MVLRIGYRFADVEDSSRAAHIIQQVFDHTLSRILRRRVFGTTATTGVVHLWKD
jgi:hypothetical protein